MSMIIILWRFTFFFLLSISFRLRSSLPASPIFIFNLSLFSFFLLEFLNNEIPSKESCFLESLFFFLDFFGVFSFSWRIGSLFFSSFSSSLSNSNISSFGILVVLSLIFIFSFWSLVSLLWTTYHILFHQTDIHMLLHEYNKFSYFSTYLLCI